MGWLSMLTVSSDFMLILASVFSTGWRIAVSFRIPGTNINIPEFVFACMMVVFVIKVVPSLLGLASWWDVQQEKQQRQSNKSK